MLNRNNLREKSENKQELDLEKIFGKKEDFLQRVAEAGHALRKIDAEAFDKYVSIQWDTEKIWDSANRVFICEKCNKFIKDRNGNLGVGPFEKCSNPVDKLIPLEKQSPYTHKWNFQCPSGVLICANDFREVFPDAEVLQSFDITQTPDFDEEYFVDLNSPYGQWIRTKKSADCGLIAVKSFYHKEIWVSKNKKQIRIGGKSKRKSEAKIYLDVWSYHVCDKDDFLNRCSKLGLDASAIEHFEVQIEPGEYYVTSDLRAVQPENVSSHMLWIGPAKQNDAFEKYMKWECTPEQWVAETKGSVHYLSRDWLDGMHPNGFPDSHVPYSVLGKVSTPVEKLARNRSFTKTLLIDFERFGNWKTACAHPQTRRVWLILLESFIEYGPTLDLNESYPGNSTCIKYRGVAYEYWKLITEEYGRNECGEGFLDWLKTHNVNALSESDIDIYEKVKESLESISIKSGMFVPDQKLVILYHDYHAESDAKIKGVKVFLLNEARKKFANDKAAFDAACPEGWTFDLF